MKLPLNAIFPWFGQLTLGLGLAWALAGLPLSAAIAKDELFVYVGTYTGAKSKGIYFWRMDAKSGALTSLGLAAELVSPSFLALHPKGTYLYAANEVGTFAGKPSGAVSAFAINPESGQLTFLNQQSSQGAGPCHLIVDKTGSTVLVANYSAGTLAALPIEKDGRLKEATSVIHHEGSSVNPNRQKEPHAHSINLDKDNRFAVAADLGLDKVLVYRFDPRQSTLTPNEVPWTKVNAGAGPRHFDFHPDSRHAYVINEIQSTVTAFDYNAAKGVLTEVETVSTLPKDFKGNNSTADVHVHPSGRFLYGSNRGHDSIAVYTIDNKTGRLSLVEVEPTQGKTPRNFGIDPSGTFLLAANQSSDTIVVFRIDPKTGALEPTGQTVQSPAPVCIKFLKP